METPAAYLASQPRRRRTEASIICQSVRTAEGSRAAAAAAAADAAPPSLLPADELGVKKHPGRRGCPVAAGDAPIYDDRTGAAQRGTPPAVASR